MSAGRITAVTQRGETRVDATGVPRDAIFRISSMTKPITAAATMILVDEGAIALDEPVDRLLPELANRRVLRHVDAPIDDTVPARRAITARDLLTFTWGFGVPLVAPGTWPIQRAAVAVDIRLGPPHPQEQPAPDEWIRRLGTLPLMTQPGEQWMYDTGSDVLGVLIARASGKPFDVFFRERIFGPLGMKDTGFSVPPADLGRLLTSYSGDLSVYDEAEGGQWSRPPAFPSGSGGLVSTIDDYLAFSHWFRKRESSMGTDQLTQAQRLATAYWLPGYFHNHGWGFGVEVDLANSRYGWDGGLGTAWRVDPAKDLELIILTQRAFTSPVPPDVITDFLSAF